MTAAFRASFDGGGGCSPAVTGGYSADTESTNRTVWPFFHFGRRCGSSTSAREYQRRYTGGRPTSRRRSFTLRTTASVTWIRDFPSAYGAKSSEVAPWRLA